MPSIPIFSRSSLIERADSKSFDVAIVGGGIHGSSVARDLSLRGLNVILLEANDYAFGTSSRSSKMLHGGVRYLENWDVPLVFEALRERDVVVRNAPHLARAQEFLYPVIPGKTRPAWQVRFGLFMYDLLAHGPKAFFPKLFKEVFGFSYRYGASSAEFKQLKELGLKFSGLVGYFDGQMDDARITAETIVDALELGAVCLNHAEVKNIERLDDGEIQWKVDWQCKESGRQMQSSAKFVINTTGPWLPAFHKQFAKWQNGWAKPAFSRGIHLLFKVPWPHKGLILPTDLVGRYYFVWPYFTPSGEFTLVGTTDREVSTNEDDPQANESEITELLNYLKTDLPNSGLNESSLYSSFCGMRILATAAEGSKQVSGLSRGEFFLREKGYLGLLGGKYTNARQAAEKMCDWVEKEIKGRISNKTRTISTKYRSFPGGRGYTKEYIGVLFAELQSTVLKNCQNNHEASLDVEREVWAAIRRFGTRVQNFPSLVLKDEVGVYSALDLLRRLQIRYAIYYEHARTVEDILRRRLGVALTPGGGSELIPIIEEELLRLTLKSTQLTSGREATA